MTIPDSTLEYLRNLAGEGAEYEFRAIHDQGKGPVQKHRGRIEDLYERLSALNGAGYGIFVTVNETDGEGVRKENVTRIRAVWGDFDGVDEIGPHLEPTMTVRTRSGWHIYYVLEDPSFQTDWGRGMNLAVAEQTGADRCATDVARVLRVPGFYHNKAEPFMVTMEAPGEPVSVEELEAYYGPPLKEERRERVSAPLGGNDTERGMRLAMRVMQDLESIPQGQGVRNHELNRKSFLMGSLVAGGLISEETGRELLYRAMDKNYSDHPVSENEATMNSGFSAGLANPWEDDESFEVGSFVSRHRQKPESSMGGLLTGQAATEKMMAELEWRKKMGFSPAPGPLVQLDSLLGGGVPAGAVSLLGAPPGQGKSSLALQWAIGCAKSKVRPALFCSLELSALDLYCRATTLDHKVNWLKVRQGNALTEFKETMDGLCDIPFYVASRDTLTKASGLAKYIEELTNEHGAPPIVVIDYIQLLVNAADTEKRAAMDAVSINLREIAKATAANMLCITSIGRAGYSFIPDDNSYPDTGLVLKMAKETGQLEYDAEVVMGIQLGPVDLEDGHQYGWICIGKNRSGGSVGYVGVKYEGVSGRFFDAKEDAVIRSMNAHKEMQKDMAKRSKEEKELREEERVCATIRGGKYQDIAQLATASDLERDACLRAVKRLSNLKMVGSPNRAKPYYHMKGEDDGI